MKLPTWKDPGRRRKIHISYTDPDFCNMYDLDRQDFTSLVVKLKNGGRLDGKENDRYGTYVLTVCMIALENPKFKNKPSDEKEEVIEQMYLELLTGITTFDPDRGSSIYSYAYRIAYTAGIHYYERKKEREERDDIVRQHCQEELEIYYSDVFDHRVRNINKV